MNSDSFKFGQYLPPHQESRWATEDEIRASGSRIDLRAKHYPAAGLPILSDGKVAYVDDRDNHALIYGTTGSNKTRLFCMPMLNIFANAGESFVVTDPKGELYSKTSGLVKAQGYKTVVLNFRDIGKGDMWNPLYIPYKVYHEMDKDSGIRMLNDFVSILAGPQLKGSQDPFWTESAYSLILANLVLLIDAATPAEANLVSLSTMCDVAHSPTIKKLVSLMDPASIAAMNFQGSVDAPDRTKQSMYSVAQSMLRPFRSQMSLTRMLSGNNIDISSIGRQKTAVYVIIPDEKTSCHFLASVFMKQVYEILISEAQKEPDFRLPVRVNFVLDEFCNIPKIPDMPAMISAARSRNIRYYLVAQSLHQMKGLYGEDANTIKGNCGDWVFLTSRERELLHEISDLCGQNLSADGYVRPLISISELQRLDKDLGEALILSDRQYPFITRMPDIDEYEMFRSYPPVPQKKSFLPEVAVFSLSDLLHGVVMGDFECPFGKPYYDYSILLDATAQRRRNNPTT